ncbi:uncharacterized protein with ParB-like and HNH nuclease domain [Saccharothrix tamanrassetensis]|uniref:Uncharacterized protein with ParB-like and HNH nuclease domain n=1 Tax=Saccharothrix tamanrassetensis TaxID=1051531 RepID=A0A841CIZ0_9PSEU|nr:DUF262 domain-containing protein [Saccharothrix tamanrassetensis]MBB5957411.1 uncharacterized protein with ParB-like and HNH nuclease domain [Saccharothrix tamanrassetensis]
MSSTSPDRHSISFDLVGIGELLESRELSVPQYQRSYSWNVSGERQIDEYWDDLERVAATSEEYFLGTVVLSRSSDSNRRTIIDGQQRLATTSMLLAAIRNHLSALGSEKAGVVERDFLAKETIKSSGKERRLKLNIEDADYFDTLIVADAGRSPDPKVPSQGRMKQAFDFLSEKIEMLAKRHGVSGLLEWTEFLHDRAKIGVIEVSTEADAYIIFETLNDRGAALTAADLLKNYLYGRSGDRLKFTQHHWARTLRHSGADGSGREVHDVPAALLEFKAGVDPRERPVQQDQS